MTIAAFTSCSDNNVEPKTDKKGCELTSVYYDGDDYKVTHDNNGRVIGYSMDNLGLIITGTISYDSGIIKVNQKLRDDSDGEVYTREDNIVYQLNKQGYIGGSSDGLTYTYNNEGYVTKIASDNYYSDLTYKNGNLIKDSFYGKGSDRPLEQFEYSYSDENYVRNSSIVIPSSESFRPLSLLLLKEQGYLGKQSKNRIVTVDNSPVVYNFDEKGNVSWIEYEFYSEIKRRLFHYECK